MYALLLLPLYSYAGSSPFVYPDDPLNEFLASDVAAIYMNQLAIVLNAHALPDLVNTHLDHTRLLENRDRNPTEQKNIHSVWNTEMFYMAQLFPDPLGTRSTFTTEAVLAGWDVRSRDLTMFGLTGGFLHSYYNRSNRDNQGSINSGFLASYSNVMLGHAYTELAAWGIYQITTNKQHIREFVVETAVADIRSWGAELHTEFGYNFDRTWGYYTPYATFDYLLTWKGVMDSTSTGPLNLYIPHMFYSTLHSEIGTKVHAIWTFNWGYLFFRQKLACVLDTAFIPEYTVSQYGVTLPLVPVYRTIPAGLVALELATSIGKPSPFDIRLIYVFSLQAPGLSNKFQLLFSKIF